MMKFDRLTIARIALEAQLDPRTVKRALEKGESSLKSDVSKARLRNALRIETLRLRPRKGIERVSLRTVRESLGKTRGDVALALQADPNEVSRIEQRPDFVLETTRRYAEALGARCEVAFVFADGRRILIA